MIKKVVILFSLAISILCAKNFYDSTISVVEMNDFGDTVGTQKAPFILCYSPDFTSIKNVEIYVSTDGIGFEDAYGYGLDSMLIRNNVTKEILRIYRKDMPVSRKEVPVFIKAKYYGMGKNSYNYVSAENPKFQEIIEFLKKCSEVTVVRYDNNSSVKFKYNMSKFGPAYKRRFK